MESQPQNPEFRNNPENFHPWISVITLLSNSYTWIFIHIMLLGVCFYNQNIILHICTFNKFCAKSLHYDVIKRNILIHWQVKKTSISAHFHFIGRKLLSLFSKIIRNTCCCFFHILLLYLSQFQILLDDPSFFITFELLQNLILRAHSNCLTYY